jgi:hypothetical protein
MTIQIGPALCIVRVQSRESPWHHQLYLLKRRGREAAQYVRQYLKIQIRLDAEVA